MWASLARPVAARSSLRAGATLRMGCLPPMSSSVLHRHKPAVLVSSALRRPVSSSSSSAAGVRGGGREEPRIVEDARPPAFSESAAGRLNARRLTFASLPTAEALPADWYASPDHFERERRGFLARQWVCVGHVSQFDVPRAAEVAGRRDCNDTSAAAAHSDGRAAFITEEVAGHPIIVVRDGRNGSLRAFHNACRHRAGPLAWTGTRGRCAANALRCQYHGWLYDCGGELRAAPAFEAPFPPKWRQPSSPEEAATAASDTPAPPAAASSSSSSSSAAAAAAAEVPACVDFDTNDYPLLPVRLANYRGLLFVRLRADALDAAAAEERATAAARRQEEAAAAEVEGRRARRIKPRPVAYTETIAADGTATGAVGDHEAFVHTHADLIREMQPVALEKFAHYAERTHDIRCNWKTYVENYAEGYHIPNMHPSLHQMVDMSGYRVRCGDGYMAHETPADPDSPIVGRWVFACPSVAINVYGGSLVLERIVPLSPTHTQIRYVFMVEEGAAPADGSGQKGAEGAIAASAAAAAAVGGQRKKAGHAKKAAAAAASTPVGTVDATVLARELEAECVSATATPAQHSLMRGVLATSKTVTDEDIAICEGVQANLSAGRYTPGRLSTVHEGGVHYFQQLCRLENELDDGEDSCSPATA